MLLKSPLPNASASALPLSSILPPFQKSPSSNSIYSKNQTRLQSSTRLNHSRKRPRGVRNLGRSCHLSATLVALSALPAFRRYIRYNLIQEDKKGVRKDHERIRGLYATLNALEEAVGLRGGRKGGVDPSEVAEWLERENGKEEYKVREDQDAFETFGRVLEKVSGSYYYGKDSGNEPGLRGLDDVDLSSEPGRAAGTSLLNGTEMNGVDMNGRLEETDWTVEKSRNIPNVKLKPNTVVSSTRTRLNGSTDEEMFQSPFDGLVGSVRRCQGCNCSAGVRLEKFSSLSLDLPGRGSPSNPVEVTLEDCFWETYGKGSNVEGIPCRFCRGTTHKLHSNVARLPQVLCLHLQRIVWRQNSPCFITTPVHYPEKLNFPSHWMQKSETNPLRPPTRRYTLEAVIQHHGDYVGGHYTAMRACRWMKEKESGLSCVLPAPWFLFNDDKCWKIGQSETHSPSAYLLFYVC